MPSVALVAVYALVRLAIGGYSSVVSLLQNVGVLLWDASLATINVIAFNRRADRVVPAGHPGHDGKWPEYIAPKEGDSRCSCPALNAMANHGTQIITRPTQSKAKL